jgi:hypothetical protein
MAKPFNVRLAQWNGVAAAEVAGLLNAQAINESRHRYRLHAGKPTGSGFKFSAVDICVLTALAPLRALGFDMQSAVDLAHRERRNFEDVLNNRLVHGFWSLGAIMVPSADGSGHRVLYLDQVAERVIIKLALPLPRDPFPRTPDIACRMVDAIFDYFQSAPGILRWERWRDAAILHGGRVPFEQAAAELGAPAWFLRAVADVQRRHEVTDLRITPPINAAVRRVAPKMFPDVGAVLIQ